MRSGFKIELDWILKQRQRQKLQCKCKCKDTSRHLASKNFMQPSYRPPDSSSGSYVSSRYKYTFFCCERRGQLWAGTELEHPVPFIFCAQPGPSPAPAIASSRPTSESAYCREVALQPRTQDKVMEGKSGTSISLLAFSWLILPPTTMNGQFFLNFFHSFGKLQIFP